MELSVFYFFVLSLAVFRLTRIIVVDKIGAFIRKPFMEELEEVNEAGEIEEYIVLKGNGIRKFFGELLSCYWCTGFWVSLVLVLLTMYAPLSITQPFIYLLAIAGVAGILEVTVRKFL